MKKWKDLKALLAKVANNPRELAKVAPALCRMSTLTVLAVRGVGGAALSTEERDALLAKAEAKEYVEIEVDVLAYEQKTGERNRNYVRFRDGAMMSVGRSGKGTPFLKNHDQYDVQSRAGTVLSSATEKSGDGEYAIRQTVKLTAPWAVSLALRGLLDSVSIGWNPTGPVMCSACDAPIYTQCWHWPGDTLTEEKSTNGKSSKLKRDPKGEIVVEWIFTEAELVETSFVNVPGVPGARVEDVRAALSAAFPGLRSDEDHEGSNKERQQVMDKELLLLLGLAEDATEEEIAAAIKTLATKAKADQAELAIHTKVLERLSKLEGEVNQREEDAFVSGALATGRITKGDEEQWRELHKHNSKRAVELMSKREPNCATPVGAARQSANDPTAVGSITGGRALSVSARRDQAITLLKANPKAALWASLFGLDAKGRFDVPHSLSATTISNNAELEPARIGFHAAFLEAVAGEMDPCLMLATEVPSNKKEENYSWVGELPGMQEWKTDRMLKVLEAYGFAIRNKKWEASLRLKNDDIADDSLGLLGPLVSDMGANARLHPGILVARLLLNGFAGTAFPDLGDGLAFDGDFFFSTTHATGSNKLAVAFSAANFGTALTMLRQQKRFDGENLYARASHLFVGVADEQLAEKVLTQEYLASGESNQYRNKAQLVVTPEFTAGEWAVADLRGAVRPVILQNREPLTTSAVGGSSNNDTVGFMYDEIWMGAKARYNAGYFDFRRIVGSKP